MFLDHKEQQISMHRTGPGDDRVPAGIAGVAPGPGRLNHQFAGYRVV